MKTLSKEELKGLSIDELLTYLTEKIPSIYLTTNNFHLDFVDGWYRPEKGNEERWARCYNMYPNSKYSERNKNETRTQFYQTVDAVIFELTGKNYHEYCIALKEASISGKNLTDKEIEIHASRYSELVTPVLTRLYSLGYNWADLCG